MEDDLRPAKRKTGLLPRLISLFRGEQRPAAAATSDVPKPRDRAAPPPAAAALILSWRAGESAGSGLLSALIGSVHLEAAGKKTPALIRNRRIEIDPRGRPGQSLTLACPPGRYDRIVVAFENLARHDRIDLELEVSIEARSGMVTRVELVVDAAALASGRDPRTAFKASATLMGESARMAIDSSRTQTVSLDASDVHGVRRVGAGLTVGPGSLPGGAQVQVRRRDPDGLPALFPRQMRVGPVIDLNADAEPQRALEVTVPYDAAAVAGIGATPDKLVVLRLDDARAVYQELRPFRVDTANHTISVRTSRLSSFFACTGGITVELPEPFRNVAGDTLFYVTADRATVAGRVEAPEAVVTLQGLDFDSSWNRSGRFAFEGVQLLPLIESPVRLRAEVDGVLAHTCDVTLRRPAPPKRIGTAHRFAGPTLKFLPAGTPVVSTGIVQVGRSSEAGVLPRLGSWQRSLARYGGVLQEYDAEEESWRSINVVPESFFENEAARMAVDGLNVFFPPLAIDDTIPEDMRFLRAVEAFLERRGEPEPGGGVREILDFAFRQVGLGVHSLSSTLPFVRMDDGFYGVAYAAATYEGIRAADASALQPFLDRLYGQQFEPLPRQRVPAGRLFFRRVSRGASEDPELVTDALVWCTSLAMQLDPDTGQPVILALAQRPAEAVGDAAPVTGASLLLCRRRSDGTWAQEQVPGSHPYVSADFAFAADGSIRIAAARLHPSGFEDALNCRMVLVGRAGELWIEEPITWVEGPYGIQRDRGIWPRLAFDARGRLVIAFCYDAKAFAPPIDPEAPYRPPTRPLAIDVGVHWFVGVYDGVEWRMNRVALAEHVDLAGSNDHDFDLALGISGQSGAGFVHWAPSIVADPRGTLWMSYGKGALHLMEIDIDSLEGTDRTVDIDRTTGFYPSLALRASGVPAVAYKDFFGRGERRRLDEVRDFTTEHVDDLHYFRFDEGNFVPPGNPPEPLAPGFAIDYVNLQGFAERVPLSCENLTRGNELLASLLMHATFDWGILPGRDPNGPVRDLRIKLSHPPLANHLERLFPRPDVFEVFIRNDRTDEDIKRIDLTIFGDLFAIDDPDGKLREELQLRSMGQVPVDPPPEEEEDEIPERSPDYVGGERPHDRPRPTRPRRPRRVTPIRLRNHFGRNGWPLSRDANLTVQAPEGDRTFWALTDAAAFATATGATAQVYQIHVDGSRLIVRIPPRITVTDRGDRNAEVCGHPQDFWDFLASSLAGGLADIIPPLPEEVRTAKLIAAAGIRFRRESQDPARPQQGSVRFVATVPHFVAWGDDPETYVLRTTTASELGFSLAPFVVQGQLEWYPRDTFVRLGEVDLTIDASSALPWWVVLLGVTGPLFVAGVFIATEIVEDILGGLAVERSGEFLDQVGGLAGLLQPLYSDFSRRRFPDGRPPALDAVLMRDQILTYWTREDGAERRTIFLATPDRLGLVAAVGAPPARRNFLLQNAGEVPVSLDDVALETPGGEFRFASTPVWPAVLLPGEAEVVGIEFVPDLPPGTRANTVNVRFNGADTITVPLSGLAQSPRSLVVRPAERLAFGVVTLGASRVMRVELANQGQGPLTVSAIRVEGDAANRGLFVVAPAAPLAVAALSSAFLDVTFTPRSMLTGGNQATLIVESDDPVNPHVEVRLVGFAAAANLLVVPTALAFTDTPVGGGLPENRQPITLYNTGLAAVTIIGGSLRLVDPVGAASPHFQLLDNGTQPIPQQDVTLPSGGQLVVLARFRPTAVGDQYAALRLRSSTAGQADVTVLMEGRGV